MTHPASDDPIVFSSGAEKMDSTRASSLVTGTTFSGNCGVYTYRLPSPDGGTTPGSPASAIAGYQPNNFSLSFTPTSASYSITPNTWPSAINDRLMFYAYYPLNGYGITVPSTATTPPAPVAGTVYSNPAMALTYTMDANPSNQIDLMYASTGPLYRQLVQLVFNHALTRITFRAILAQSIATMGDDAVVKVADIRIDNVRNKGVLTVPTTGPASWALSSVSTDNRTIDMSIAYPNPSPSDSITWDGNGQLLNTKINDQTPVNIMGGSGDLLVIPQDNSPLMMDVTIIGTKTVTTGTVQTKKNITEHNYMVFTGDNTYPWTMGRYIQYTLYITRDVIYLGAKTYPWYTSTNYNQGTPYTGIDSSTGGDPILEQP